MEHSSAFNKTVDDSISSEENNIKEIEKFISTLPQESSWTVSKNLYKYQGFWCFSHFLKGVILLQRNFVPRPTDILLGTYPKSGTTWLKALSFAILTRTQYTDYESNSSTNPLLTNMPHDVVPFLEGSYARGKIRDPENPLIHTHIPFTSLPKSIVNSNCKIIYLCRDPKDVVVSQWHFAARIDANAIQFQESYEKFCNGVSNFGPYWNHILGYWKASLEFPERILFLKYEDLKNDTCFYVKKMADFMGCPFSVDEEKQRIVEKIVELCSFENLSNLEVNKSKHIRSSVFLQIENNAYFRKGKIGDWKNYLTVEMAERLDKITCQHFNGSGVYM